MSFGVRCDFLAERRKPSGAALIAERRKPSGVVVLAERREPSGVALIAERREPSGVSPEGLRPTASRGPILHRLAMALSLAVCITPTTAVAENYIPGQPVAEDSASWRQSFLREHCVDCHGGPAPEANLSLDNLGPVDEANADTWKSVWAQVSLREMPPEDMPPPPVVDRIRFTDWVASTLSQQMRDQGGFGDPMTPEKGNFVDHDLLFGPLPDGIELRPTSTPARIWRISPQEHITRLNELINREPAFDPDKPGLRTHGDAVPTNHGGELKLYFGTDRIIQWQGGTVAYATAVKSVPAVLASARDHGFENYPHLYSVNGAEATQIMGVAHDILRYMAEGPLSIAEPYQITDRPSSIANKMKGDLRGLPTSIVYSTEVKRPLTPLIDFMQADGVDETLLRRTVDFLFEALTFRPPSDQETNDYMTLVGQSIDRLGKNDGAILGLSAIFLDSAALFRTELARDGRPDQHGRVMLQDWELGLAVNHALRYLQPDEPLRRSIVDGQMRTRQDVRREVRRMLADPSIRKPRVLQFFRDYFDYDLGGYVCKDDRALRETGIANQGDSHYRAMFDATASTDRLIESILWEDRDVLKQLLTTNRVVATENDAIYFGRQRGQEEQSAWAAVQKRAEAALQAKLASELAAWKEANPGEEPPKRLTRRRRPDTNVGIAEANLAGPETFARVSRRSFGNGSMKPERIMATAPAGERLGILTHPGWLVSHSDAMDNHAIRRGHWIRERLLGGGIPDVPITVDAMLPDEPKTTLRERMRVTRQDYCWTCHQKMDPLGLPFEMYNHAGIYRTEELGRPVDASGEIIDSGDESLDGPVDNAIDMIEKLADSERVEQVFVRHAFRFWMGRNETLHDGPVLRAAHDAYRDGGGSFNALLESLLTSDAFLYRNRKDR